MTQSAPSLIWFAHFRHGQRRHGSGGNARLFERALQCQRVHDGRKNAHHIGGHPRDALLRDPHAAKDVAAADDDADCHAELESGAKIAGNALDGRLMDAKLIRPHQGFAGHFHDYAAVARLSHGAWITPRLITRSAGRRLTSSGCSSYFSGKIGPRPIDTLS